MMIGEERSLIHTITKRHNKQMGHTKWRLCYWNGYVRKSGRKEHKRKTKTDYARLDVGGQL